MQAGAAGTIPIAGQPWDGKDSVHEGGFASLPVREAPFLHFKATQLVVCSKRRLEAGKPTLRLDLNPDGAVFVALDLTIPAIPSVRGQFHISIGQFKFDRRVSLIQLVERLQWQTEWWTSVCQWIELEPFGRGLHYGVLASTPFYLLARKLQQELLYAGAKASYMPDPHVSWLS
eukprot:s7432_g4.t1